MKRWFLDGYINQIKLIEQRNRPDVSDRGTFFDTWEEAHEKLVSREEIRVIEAKRAMDKAIKSYKAAKKMKKKCKEE